jgi:anionic cell wall polymer biosynthesis LytR-Cps2A-Psr (LCP) family protein
MKAFQSLYSIYILIVGSILVFSLTPIVVNAQEDNSELRKMYEEDQSDRKVNPIDWNVLHERDQKMKPNTSKIMMKHYGGCMILIPRR